MNDRNYSEFQRAAIAQLQVASEFNAKEQAEHRISFLCDYLRKTGLKSYVLGISGGIDSSVAGKFCQLAVERLRQQEYEAEFIAVRLPYGIQLDEDDAQKALRFIQPDRTIIVDIKPGADGMLAALHAGKVGFSSVTQEDFILGNIKARQRMIAQYAIASAYSGLVIGTDHAAEALMGFFTKFGDGACDLTPLTGLNKRRIRAIGRILGAPDDVVEKVPTADLENFAPQRPDEDAYGITYDEIDDFLEGKEVSAHAYQTIFRFYNATHHKRALPAHPAA